jgi:hypothetical protein
LAFFVFPENLEFRHESYNPWGLPTLLNRGISLKYKSLA